MSTDKQERLIQRAIDGELSGEQRRTLLEQCGRSRDGWKSLACAFLEDQLIRQAVGDGSGLSAVDDTESAVPVRPAARVATRWYHYPAVTVPLTMCAALLLGMLMPWDGLSERGPSAQTAPISVMSAADGPRQTELELQALRRQMWDMQQVLYDMRHDMRRDQFMNNGLNGLFPLVVPPE